MENTFTDKMFFLYRDFIYQNYGIYYSDSKKELLSLKLYRCLKNSGVNTYDEYFKRINSDEGGHYLSQFVDEITVNKTDFFRENDHFDFIKSEMDFICSNNPNILKNKEIKVWSMACSTGQEPHTIAITLKETLPKIIQVKILATDVSSRVLKIAAAGIYPEEITQEVSPYYLEKYFSKTQDDYEVKQEIKQCITFRQFNLMNPFPFTGCFDIIFCRNVMIYFNLQTQIELLEKVYRVLAPGGLLIMGQSESILNKNHKFKHIKSSIYIK